MKADICFLGTNAIDAEQGITDNDWDVVQLKKAMIESSRRVICLSIAEKINSVQPIRVCGLADIDMLITELPAEDPLLQPYRDAGVNVA
jgi:DeoR/GlpR family transcriptional regulator of sugar metabolism